MPSGEIKQKFILDFDDLMPVTPGLDHLISMKEHYPNFKCTCFTPAFNAGIFRKQLNVKKFQEWYKMIHEYDWIEIAPHGFVHQRGECLMKDKKIINKMIDTIEGVFKQSETKFIKVFKAPFWEMSKEFEEVLC